MDSVSAGYQQLTNLAASTALPSIPAQTSWALIQAEAQDVRWRDDGTAPTATVGMLLKANDMLYYEGKLSTFRAIQAASGGILNITYYKQPGQPLLPRQPFSTEAVVSSGGSL